MDGRLRRYVPLDVFVAFEQPGVTLKKKWGMEGVCAWALFLAACKREPVQGTFTYSTEEEGWSKLGAKATLFSLEDLFNVTGRLKNTSRRRSGEVVYVSCTKWGLWNDAYGRQLEAEKKASIRAQNRGDSPPPKPGQSKDVNRTDSELELDSESERKASTGTGFEIGEEKGKHVWPTSTREQLLAAVAARDALRQREDAA